MTRERKEGRANKNNVDLKNKIQATLKKEMLKTRNRQASPKLGDHTATRNVETQESWSHVS